MIKTRKQYDAAMFQLWIGWKVSVSNSTGALGRASGSKFLAKLPVIFLSIKIKNAVINIGRVELSPCQWHTLPLGEIKRLIKTKNAIFTRSTIRSNVTVDERKFSAQPIRLRFPIRYSYLKGAILFREAPKCFSIVPALGFNQLCTRFWCIWPSFVFAVWRLEEN